MQGKTFLCLWSGFPDRFYHTEMQHLHRTREGECRKEKEASGLEGLEVVKEGREEGG